MKGFIWLIRFIVFCFGFVVFAMLVLINMLFIIIFRIKILEIITYKIYEYGESIFDKLYEDFENLME